MSSAMSPPSAVAHSRKLTPLSRPDRYVISLFFLVPLALYGIPALFGHLIAPGDDFNQNLPLRVLSGEFIRSGTLPSWNPLIWSGTPLLGGWNAGALFPGTFLFAFLPLSLAWVINLALAPAFAGVGLYLLLRRFNLGETAASFGALVFSYTGFMAGQIVHIGLDQGTAFTPWILLALDLLLRENSEDEDTEGQTSWWRHTFDRATLVWIIVLSVAIAGTVLAGDPRAISSGVLFGVIYLIALVIRPGARLKMGLAPIGIATALGFMLCAIQLLPGIAFTHSSQRGTTALSFFGSGSLPIRAIVTDLLVPFALGANGTFGMPVYNGNYNLPEVTIGAGLVSLVAFFAYIPELFGPVRIVLSRQRIVRQLQAKRQIGVWFVMAAVGFVLTIGTESPIGNWLVHLPFYGSERLQNRNAVLFDLALAVLGAIFVDDHLKALLTGDLGADRIRRIGARLLGLVPIVGVLIMITVELVSPLTIQRFMNAFGRDPTLNTHLLGYLIPAVLIALVLGAFWLTANHWSAPFARRVLGLLMFCDIGIFLVNASYTAQSSTLFRSQTTASAKLKTLLQGQGRFAIYDPYYVVASTGSGALPETGMPDLNVVQGNPSVQGYGSLVNGTYQRVTGSHLLNNFKPAALSSETVNSLDDRIFLTPTTYLESAIGAHADIPLPSSMQHLAPGVPWRTSGPWLIKAGESMDWQLSSTFDLRRLNIALEVANATSGPVRVTLYRGVSVAKRLSMSVSKLIDVVPLGDLPRATAIEITNTSADPITVVTVTAVTAHPGTRLVLNGILQGRLSLPHWVYDGVIGPLTAFKNTEIHGLAWLQPLTTHTPNTRAATTGRVVITRGKVTTPQVMRVFTDKAALLVRSQAYSSGWNVDITPLSGGRTYSVPVHRFGLIQEVTVPAGKWRVTWHYQPKTIIYGTALSLFGLLIILGFAGVALRRRFKRS